MSDMDAGLGSRPGRIVQRSSRREQSGCKAKEDSPLVPSCSLRSQKKSVFRAGRLFGSRAKENPAHPSIFEIENNPAINRAHHIGPWLGRGIAINKHGVSLANRALRASNLYSLSGRERTRREGGDGDNRLWPRLLLSGLIERSIPFSG